MSVRLAEVDILVTDKRGNAITDLGKKELQIREKGTKRKIAALEPFATADLSARLTAAPAPLFTNAGERLAAAEDELQWPAPVAVRHIILLFDAFNSRTPDRKRWIAAARGWVRDEMRPTDRVALAIVERGKVDLVVPFKGDKETLLGYLTGESLVAGGKYYDYMNEIRNLLDDLQTCVTAYEPDMCSLSATQAYIHEWRVRTNQTLAALRRFSASLGAIPGRKAVFYMSDGLVVNPGDMATHAVLATLGSDTVSYNRASTMLAQDLSFDIVDAMNVANVANVAFFTFDTRHSSRRDVSWMAEERVAVHERTVADPFAVMFDVTRASLDTMSVETGGRSYHGPGIEANLPRAIKAIEGHYTVAYYRDARIEGDPKVKVTTTRKGVRITHLRKTKPRTRIPSPARLEIGVATPQRLVDEMLVPVVVQIPASEITFTHDEGMMIGEVALYGEAISDDGERIADVFEVVAVSMTPAEHRDLDRSARFSHPLRLAVTPGSYRLRVRFSEPEFRFGAERVVDITVGEDGTLAGGDPKN